MRFRLTPSISVVIAALSIEAKSSGANAAGSLRRHAPPVLDLARRPAWSFAAIRTRSTPSARRSSGVILRARSISSSWASRAPAAHNSRERERSPFAADEAICTAKRRARSSKAGQGPKGGRTAVQSSTRSGTTSAQAYLWLLAISILCTSQAPLRRHAHKYPDQGDRRPRRKQRGHDDKDHSHRNGFPGNSFRESHTAK